MAAEPDFWLREVSSVASANGCWIENEIERAKSVVVDCINEVSILAFEFRHQPSELAEPLAFWIGCQQQSIQSRWVALLTDEEESESSDQIALIVRQRLVDRISEVARHFEQVTLPKSEPNKLKLESLASLEEAVVHLRKALSRVRLLTSQNALTGFGLHEEALERALHELEACSVTNMRPAA